MMVSLRVEEVLWICCEDGDVEYDEEKLKKSTPDLSW